MGVNENKVSKNSVRGYVILAVILAVFCVVSFAPPFCMNGVFGIAFIFGIIAIAYQIYVFGVGFKCEDVKSRFYGFPIIRIGLIYMCVQLVISIVEMCVAELIPAWVAGIINILPIAVAVIGTISTEVMRDEIVRQDEQIKVDVSGMRNLQSLAASLVGMCKDDDMKKNFQDLADEFRYSDPVSSDATKEIETELELLMSEIRNAIVDGDMKTVEGLCARIRVGLDERNRICKLGK